ncbi:MAG: NAD(P)H-hydrate dehydratase [Planctomycetota bacterium]
MSRRLPSLPPRPAGAHKGAFGTCLLIGGSRGMMGAIVLAGRAAMRSGVGLTRIAVPGTWMGVLPVAVPEATSVGMEEEEGALAAAALEPLLAEAEDATAVGVGPGLSRLGSAPALVRALVPRLPRPAVLDADALNAFEGRIEELREARTPLVLTPHPGEAGRLLGCTSSEVQADRGRAASELAERSGATIVLKGAGTRIQAGKDSFVKETGNPGMATGGSGDVLTGILTGLLAQGMTPLDAARLAVAAHGLAGDLAAKSGSQAGLIAGDLVRKLPEAWRRLGGD